MKNTSGNPAEYDRKDKATSGMKLPSAWPFPKDPQPLTKKQLQDIAYGEAEKALL
jgi:hypothetical protein